jgi:hypothetical protein
MIQEYSASGYSLERIDLSDNTSLFTYDGIMFVPLFKFEEVVLFPTSRAPIKFKGNVLKEGFYLENDTSRHHIAAYITNKASLVFCYIQEELEKENIIRVKAVNTYHDVWTLYPNCEKKPFYRDFLESLGSDLGDDTMFWNPIV